MELSLRIPKTAVRRINSFQPSFRRCMMFSAIMAWVVPFFLGMVERIGLPRLYSNRQHGEFVFHPFEISVADDWYRVWFGLNIGWHNSMVFLIDLGMVFIMAIMAVSGQYLGARFDRWRNKGEWNHDIEGDTFVYRMAFGLLLLVHFHGRFGDGGDLFSEFNWASFSTLILPHGIPEIFALSFTGALTLYLGSRFTSKASIGDWHNLSMIVGSKWILKVLALAFMILTLAGLVEGIVSTGLYENIYRGGEAVFPGRKLF